MYPSAHRCSQCRKKLTLKNSCKSVFLRGNGYCKTCDTEYRAGRQIQNKRNQQKHLARYGRAIIDKNRFRRLLEIKFDVFSHYCDNSTPHCQCEGCPIKFLEGLSIDHIKGGGHKHKNKNGTKMTGAYLLAWLKKSGYPKGYQILCSSCNLAKGVRIRCPAYGKDHTEGFDANKLNKIKKEIQMSIIESSKKNYENASTGKYIGTIIDVYDFVKDHPKYGRQEKVRIFWVLNANDSQGKPLSVKWDGTRKMSAGSGSFKASNLFKLTQDIFGVAPTLPFDTESLMGRSNELVIVRTNPDAQGNVYANVVAVGPIPAGQTPPTSPQGFVRSKDKTQGAGNTVGTTTTAQPTTYGTATEPTPAVQVQPAQTQPVAVASGNSDF